MAEPDVDFPFDARDGARPGRTIADRNSKFVEIQFEGADANMKFEMFSTIGIDDRRRPESMRVGRDRIGHRVEILG